MTTMAQAGVEAAASVVLSEGGLPVAYRAALMIPFCPEQESNLHTLGFKPSRSAVGVPGPQSENDPGWTRTIVAWV